MVEDAQAAPTKLEQLLDLLLMAPWWVPSGLASICVLALIGFMFWVAPGEAAPVSPSGESAEALRAQVKLERERRRARELELNSADPGSIVSAANRVLESWVETRTLTTEDYEKWDKVDPLHLWQAASLWAGLNVNLEVMRFDSPGYVRFSMLLRAVEFDQIPMLDDDDTVDLKVRRIMRDDLKKYAESIGEKPAFLFPEVRQDHASNS